jgi:hypothetical protein
MMKKLWTLAYTDTAWDTRWVFKPMRLSEACRKAKTLLWGCTSREIKISPINVTLKPRRKNAP